MLLRVGVYMMAVALTLIAVVALVSFLDRPMEPAAAVKSRSSRAVEPLVRSDPGVDPWVEERVPLAKPEPEPAPEPEPEPGPERQAEPQPRVAAPEQAEAQPRREKISKPETEERAAAEPEPLPVEEADWPASSEEQVEATNEPGQ